MDRACVEAVDGSERHRLARRLLSQGAKMPTNRTLAVLLSACAFASGCGETADHNPGVTPPQADGGANAVSEAMVPTRDGTRLWTRVYLPAMVPPGGVPTVVERTPYAFMVDGGFDAQFASFYNQRGYAYVFQTDRGIYKSEGTFFAYEDDIADGADLVDWVIAQDFSRDDQVGTVGCSYDGFTALAAAEGNPRVKMVFADGPVASEAFSVAGGVAFLDTLSWLHVVDTGDWVSDAQAAQGTNTLDVPHLDHAWLGHESPFWQAMVADMRPDAPFWATHGLESHWADLCAPVLVTSSSESTEPAVWNGVSQSSCPAMRSEHRLLVLTGGQHCDPTAHFMAGDGSSASKAISAFFDEHLTGSGAGIAAPVQYRIDPKSDALTAADAFPPHEAVDLTFYLQNTSTQGGSLVDAAASTSTVASMVVDPQADDPCDPGYAKVLTYVSAPLSRTITVVGTPELVLWGASSAVDADFFAEVATPSAQVLFGGARARYRNGGATPQLLTPNQPVELHIQDGSASVFTLRAGEAITLYVTGAACHYNENPHTGEPVAAQTQRLPSTHQVFTSSAQPSRLRLSVLP
jgi:putative CocE/NonD family hydrolase